DERAPLRFADIEDGGDVRVPGQPRGRQRLALEALPDVRILGETVGENLDRDAAPELRVLGGVDVRHPSSADQFWIRVARGEGEGSLKGEGRAYELEPEMGAYVARESFVVDNPGPDNVLVVLVTAPAHDGTAADPDLRTVKLAERDPLPAGTDREFRYLVHQD